MLVHWPLLNDDSFRNLVLRTLSFPALSCDVCRGAAPLLTVAGYSLCQLCKKRSSMLRISFAFSKARWCRPISGVCPYPGTKPLCLGANRQRSVHCHLMSQPWCRCFQTWPIAGAEALGTLILDLPSVLLQVEIKQLTP